MRCTLLSIPRREVSQRRGFQIAAIWCIMVLLVKLRMNVYLNAMQKKVLEQLSDKTGAPVVELIRRAIDVY